MAVRKAKFKWSKKYTIIASVAALLIICGVAIAAGGNKAKTIDTSSAGSGSGSSTGLTVSLPATSPPKPHAQVVADYKASAQQVTLANLQKDPNAYKGKVITFTATISKFLQDSSGNTGAMNVDDPNDLSSAYVNLSSYIDLSKVNKDDTVQIWGTGLGIVSGKNAFGGDINVSGVNETYLGDTITGYSDDTNPNP